MKKSDGKKAQGVFFIRIVSGIMAIVMSLYLVFVSGQKGFFEIAIFVQMMAGFLLLLGFLTRPSAFVIICTNIFFITEQYSLKHNILWIFSTLPSLGMVGSLLLIGPGETSLDRRYFHSKKEEVAPNANKISIQDYLEPWGLFLLRMGVAIPVIMIIVLSSVGPFKIASPLSIEIVITLIKGVLSLFLLFGFLTRFSALLFVGVNIFTFSIGIWIGGIRSLAFEFAIFVLLVSIHSTGPGKISLDQKLFYSKGSSKNG